MPDKDLYDILGVDRSASEADIKKAYRRLAMKFHPDRNPGDAEAEQRFKEVQAAYDILMNAEKRAAYDRFGFAGIDPSRGGGGGGAGFGDNFADIFGDVFSDIFGGGRSRGPARGADLGYEVELTLEEAARGHALEIQVPARVPCETCEGSGARPGSTPKRCETCGGVGQVRMRQGFFSVQQACPSCRGAGEVIDDPCRECRGSGSQEKRKTLSVKVPAGVDTGDRIRLSGEGDRPPGGVPGDLYVEVRIAEHPIFERRGGDLHAEIPISIVTAALGGEVEVPSLDGRLQVAVPRGTQTGKTFRLRGKGMPSVRGHGVGDLLCRVVVETPVRLDDEQEKLLLRLGETLGESHSPQQTSWMDRVKRFFDA